MLFILALIAFVAAEISAADRTHFQSWMATHNKVYASMEEQSYRLSVFAKSADFVRNFDASRGFTVGLNQYADLTSEEFVSIYNGMNVSKTYEATNFPVTAPSSVDWRSKGAVTGVKNQGQCGSCWSFSTTGSVEGATFLSTGKLVSLSEQNLVDCSTAQGNDGCNGGLMDDAFKYIISNHGIDTEASYPYTATGPNACRFKSADVGATIASFTDVAGGSEAALATAVNKQPVSVAIDAGHTSFQMYSSGVYYEPACSASQLDHGVLAVGYGTDGSSDFWYVKNSWGTSWGMSGYIWMSRNRNNNCGIATMASYPVA
jgi:cathepsin L